MATAQRGRAPSPPVGSAPASRPRARTESCSTYYREMLLIRRFEEKAGQLYGMGLIGGFCHLYIGQEAVAVGMQHGARGGRLGDHRLSRPRPHAGRPAWTPRVMAELTGRAAATPRARAARCTCSPRQELLRRPRHRRRLRAARHRHRVRPQVPRGRRRLPVLPRRRRGQPGPGLRGFNMAALWKLPVVYVIENNKYGMGTSVERASAGDRAAPARRGLRHPGRAGRRHGRAGGAARPPRRRSPMRARAGARSSSRR